MNIKEITELRKSGRLKDALEAAEKEFSQNANCYTAGALFWCLNDLTKTQSVEQARVTIDKMQSLYEGYGGENQSMKQTLDSIQRLIQPYYTELKKALEKAKVGEDIHAEYRTFKEHFTAGDLGVLLYADFGWLIYYALKRTPTTEVYTRKEMLFIYLQLDLPKPSMLHSLILCEAIKVERNTPLQFRFRDFIRMWGLEYLREEDWETFRTEDGKTLPSSVEKLIGVYTKELDTDKVAAPADFNQLVDRALDKFPHNQNLPYFKAIVLISQGKGKEALTYYKELILRFPSKSYLWNQTAELVDDLDTKIGLLCKAVSCGEGDEFLGGIRLKLASLFVQKEQMSNAKLEIEKYRKTYQDKGWSLKTDFWKIYNHLANVEPADTNNALYAEYAIKADDFVYSSLPTVFAVKVAEAEIEDRNHPGRRMMVWILRTEESTVKLRKPLKFKLNKRTPNGTVFDVKIRDNKIVWIKQHTGKISEPWLKEQSGEVHIRIDRNGKKYAILSGSYVNEKLLQSISEGQYINVLSCLQKDGRWSAVSISEE